jgi:hypothetical protein
MFIPKAGMTYSSNVSDLSVKVLTIPYRDFDKGIIKAKLCITNKNNGLYYTTKYYTLTLSQIQHWTVL